MEQDLTHFLQAQENSYTNALQEIKNGRKGSHWMWYIFPQMKGLGRSPVSDYYGIHHIEQATAYLQHPILGERLITICQELIKLPETDAYVIFGRPDDMKLKSSMTLFSQVENANSIFSQVLDKFFHGRHDQRTLRLLGM